MISEFLAITSLAALAVISPGPDFALVTANAASGSKRAGYFTAIGIAASILLHTTYCVLGIALFIARTKVLFDAVKYVGAVYLFYVGIKGITSRRKSESTANVTTPQGQKSNIGWITSGFLCNALNPKTTFFFLSLYTLVIQPSTPAFVQALYGLEISVMHLAWFFLVTAIITHERWKAKMQEMQYYVVKLMGGALIYFSFRIFTFAGMEL